MKCAFAVIAIGLMCIAPSFAAETRAKPIKALPPTYPSNAKFKEREGWVYAEFSITAEGSVAGMKIVSSYPAGVFDEVVLETGRKYKFTPKTVDGVATDEPAYRMSFIFSMVANRGVTKRTYDDFKKISSALQGKAYAEADSLIEKIRDKLEAGQLNLTEVARYYQFAAVIAGIKQDHLKAAEYIEYTLRLAPYLDNKMVVEALHQQMIAAFLGMGQYHNVVDYYDSWVKESPSEVPEHLQKGVAQLRQQGFGRGRVYQMTSVDEASGKKNSDGVKYDYPDPQPSREESAVKKAN